MNPKILFITLSATLILLVGGIFLVSKPVDPAVATKYDNFARCLTEKGFQMYGTASCVYCQRQKQMFNESFKYITYTDCVLNPKACTDAGIESTPTWVSSDGTRLVGQQPLEKLAEASSCQLP